jgi:hypothetical protein
MRTFVYGHDLQFPASDYTKQSRYILYDDGAFVMHFEGHSDTAGGDGVYTETNGAVTFVWASGAWTATGSLGGDLLTVRYNAVAQGADFEDVVYKLLR